MGGDDKETFSGALNTLLETSSAHGLPNIHRSKSLICKAVWTLLFFGGVTALIIQVLSLFTAYLKFEYSVSLDVRFDRSLDFPAVTVCNFNPVRRSKLETASDEFRELFDVNYVPEHDTLVNPASGTGETVQQQLTTLAASNATTEEAVVDWIERETGDFYRERDDGFLKEQRLIAQLANLTENERKDKGHSLDSMLLDCQWKGYPCSPSNFSSFTHYKFGNCYTFNSFKFGDPLRTNRPGPLYGLTMELFLEQDEYMPEITESAGFRLVVHDRDVMPFPEDDGISIAPGAMTAIGVRVVNIERLSEPYGNCSNKDVKPDKGNIFVDNYGVKYSLKACERGCYQMKVISMCGCFDPYYPNALNNTVYPCNVDDDKAQSCMSTLEDQYKEGNLTCDCFQQCNETTYLTAASSALWPSDQFQAKLFRDLNDRNPDVRANLRQSSPRDWLLKNVAKVEIYFQEFNFEYIKQSPAYTGIALISDIGGQLGLWLGLSLLTMFELFQHSGKFLVLLARRLYNGPCGRGKTAGSSRMASSEVQIRHNIKIFPTEDPGVSLSNY